MSSEKLAIVGISVELPSGAQLKENLDHESFYRFILDGGETYQSIPSNRFNVEAWLGTGVGHIHVNGGSFLKDIDMFDNAEFGISSRDAQAMAPAARKLLENSFLALLDSGIDYRMKNVGVYTSGVNHEITSVTEPDEFEPRGSFAGYPSMVANRISNHLDLLGPSVPTDTACSSTLTAFHLAATAIQVGDCDTAVVAGCQMNHRFLDWITYSQGSLLAKDGKCKPFDASADGFSRAEGCAAVVIKPLSAALKDNDRIYATVLGTSINNAGAAAPPGAPVAEAQCAAMEEAYRRAGRSPKEVDFVELHATGTAKGDPTEANWAGRSFKRDREVLVGSVKGNLGHPEITAFLASLSKVLSIFEHKVIPPTANLKIPNPAIHWDEYNLRAPTVPTPLGNAPGKKSLISISSSGIGAANGHVLLEDGPDRSLSSTADTDGPVLILAGGLTPRAATAIAQHAVDAALAEPDNSRVLSTVTGRRAKQMTWRSYAVLTGAAQYKISPPQLGPRKAAPVVFVFSGQGPQHVQMGRELFQKYPVFRESILDMDEVFKRVTSRSIIKDHGLFDGPVPRLPEPWPISLLLPSIAMFQIAMFDLLISLGIKPDIVVGHSAGETSVLYASGAAPRAMAIEIAVIRGLTFSAVEPHGGTMAAVSASPDVVEGLIKELAAANTDGIVELACYNSPGAVAIAGHEVCVDRVVELAQSRGFFARKIRTRVPIHSSMMELIEEEYVAKLHELWSRYPGAHVPTIPTYSTLTGQVFAGDFDRDYFWRNTRGTVKFTQAMENLGFDQAFTFVEITPHPVLASYLSSMFGDSSNVVCPARRPKTGAPTAERFDLLDFVGKFTSAGHNGVDFVTLNGKACYESKVKLPPYPFVKKQFPLYPETGGYLKQIASRLGPLNYPYLRVNKDTHSILGEHVIRGEPIMPAAGFIEMALEYGATSLINVNLRSILSLSSEKPVQVEIALDNAFWTVKSVVTTLPPQHDVSSKPAQHISRLHADGYLSFEPPKPQPKVDIAAIRAKCPTHVGAQALYPALAYFSAYGPRFRRITDFFYGEDEALVSIVGPDNTLRKDGNYFLHPAVLDSCLHCTAYKPFHGDFNQDVYYLPAHVDAVVLHKPSKPHYLPGHIYAHLKVVEWAPDSMKYNIALFGDDGEALATLRGLQVAKHRIVPAPVISGALDIGFESVASGGDSLLAQTKALVFDYKLGNESDLQAQITPLDAAEEHDIWILAAEGRDSAAAQGLTRALSREFGMWKIRLVVFPPSFSQEQRRASLKIIPSNLLEEPEVHVSLEGTLSIPRMRALGDDVQQSKPSKLTLSSGKVRVEVQSISLFGDTSSIVACVLETGDADIPEGSLIAGITSSTSSPFETLELDSNQVTAIDASLARSAEHVTAALPGLLTAVLAPGLSTFKSSTHLQRLRVLLTHSSSNVGSVLRHVYSTLGVNLTVLDDNASLLELASLGFGSFDLIISGYEDRSHAQVLETLLDSNHGRIFTWPSGLASVVARDVCTLKDVLKSCVSFLADSLLNLVTPAERVSSPPKSIEKTLGGTFHPDKTYLILGGIGSIGANIALYMYQRGARHIVITSRSGERGLQQKPNRILKRMITYLRRLEDLDLRLEAVDGSSSDSMKSLVDRIEAPIAGSVILTSVLIDRLFTNLTPEEFAIVFNAKSGVYKALTEATDVPSQEFVIAFTSVSGNFGFGGQSNYGAANTLLEHDVGSTANGFAFVCPGIVDSSLMLSDGIEGREHVLREHLKWSISAEDMILWLDDSIAKFQNGGKFTRYIPNLDWATMNQTLGMTKLGEHLLPPPEDETDSADIADDVPSKIAAIVQKALSISKEDYSPDIPLTSYGLDSLSASRVSVQLRPFVEVSQIQLLADIAVNGLLRKIAESTSEITTDLTDTKASNVLTKEDMLKHYLAELDSVSVAKRASLADPSGQVVFVTGTTGVLGASLLAKLLERSDVERVYAFNRPSAALQAKQEAALSDIGFSSSLARSSKLVLLGGDLTQANFGLSPTEFKQLETVTHVIQNAWSINFTANLADFHDLVKGTGALINFASGSGLASGTTLSFISSIAVYHSQDYQQRQGPEAATVEGQGIEGGYLESKWAAERLVHLVSEKRGLKANVIRTGLLSGTTNGHWNISHWVPALVESSLHVGCLPSGTGTVSWIPVTLAAEAILDLRPTSVDTVHVIHPRPTTWNNIMQPLAAQLGVPLVPYVEWLARLEFTTGEAYSGARPAALRILQLYARGGRKYNVDGDSLESMGLLPRVDGSKGTRLSKTLSNPALPSLGASDVNTWVGSWRSQGFLP